MISYMVVYLTLSVLAQVQIGLNKPFLRAAARLVCVFNPQSLFHLCPPRTTHATRTTTSTTTRTTRTNTHTTRTTQATQHTDPAYHPHHTHTTSTTHTTQYAWGYFPNIFLTNMCGVTNIFAKCISLRCHKYIYL